MKSQNKIIKAKPALQRDPISQLNIPFKYKIQFLKEATGTAKLDNKKIDLELYKHPSNTKKPLSGK